MIKQPEKNYRLTDEEYDYVNSVFDNLAKRGDDDAAWICAKLYKQHTYNPSDESSFFGKSEKEIINEAQQVINEALVIKIAEKP